MAVPRKLSDQLEAMLAPNSNGRRNSAAKIIDRLRSGSLPGYLIFMHLYLFGSLHQEL